MNKPNISIKFEDQNFKILELIGQPGDLLPSHKVDIDALLFIQDGSVKYSESDREINLNKNDIHSIPKNIVHQLNFDTESTLLLILIPQSKMQFTHS